METVFFEQDPQQERLRMYQSRIETMEHEFGVPNGVITEEMRHVGAEMLLDIYNRYGDPASETFKQYHNDNHALDVLGRAWNQLRLLKTAFPDRFNDHDYRLLLFAAIGHDSVHGTGGAMGSDEEQSAEWTLAHMRRLGFDETDGVRVREAVVATTVKTREEDGAIIQTYIRKNSNDPLKFIMAYADINGMLMGGLPVFANDSLNLYLELQRKQASDIKANKGSLQAFFGRQMQFIYTRLEELDKDYAFYFKDDASVVKQLYYDTFTRASRDAYSVVRTIDSRPRIMELIIDDLVRVIDETDGDEQEKLAVAKYQLMYRFSN